MELLSDTVSMARSEDHSADAKSEDIRVRSFIQAIIDVQVERYRVEDFKIVLDCEPQMMIRSVNSFALTSLLTNLISNAIKYCPDPAGRVRVKVSGRRVDNDGGLTTVIEVEDEGIGIPPEFNKRLFQSFQRADNVSNIEGTGLGMTIVKSALDTLRGDIWVESVPVRLRGSRFVVTIPNTFERMTPQDLQSITLPL
jgi:signal transduction histidine kinase